MGKQDKWTPEQGREYFAKKEHQKNNSTRLKFGNVPSVIDGIRFDSKKEAEYYGKLKMRLRAGELSRIACHVPYPLIVNGKLITTYEADFVLYFADGRQIVQDVKGKATEGLPVFKIKRALMLAIHNIHVEIV